MASRKPPTSADFDDVVRFYRRLWLQFTANAGKAGVLLDWSREEMRDSNKLATEATQLRLKLVGKPLIGFDTRLWGTRGTDSSVRGRTGTKVGTKNAPAKI